MGVIWSSKSDGWIKQIVHYNYENEHETLIYKKSLKQHSRIYVHQQNYPFIGVCRTQGACGYKFLVNVKKKIDIVTQTEFSEKMWKQIFFKHPPYVCWLLGGMSSH